MRILIATSDQRFALRAVHRLEAAQQSVRWVADGYAALQEAVAQPYDVLILDQGLPRLDGGAICRRLRKELQSEIPIVVCQSVPALPDTLAAFRDGADDVVSTRIEADELHARIHALTRRWTPRGEGIFRVGTLSFNPQTQELRFGGKDGILLSPATRRLLIRLMKDSPRLVSSDDLRREIWGPHPPPGGSLRAHIAKVRLVIAHSRGSVRLQTVRSAGYRLLGRSQHSTAP